MLTALLLLACAHGPSTAEGEADDPNAGVAVTTELDETQDAVVDADEPPKDEDAEDAEHAADEAARAEHSEHAEHAAEQVGARPSKPAPACGDGGARVSSALSAEASAADADDRLTIVLTLADGAEVPALLQEPLVAGQLVQGWVDAGKLCEIAAIEGVQSIRAPIEASPK